MKIYIETEMTEMPKNCLKYGSNGQCCFNYYSCRAHNEKVSLKSRPAWCPLRTEQQIKEAAKE